MKFSIIFKLVFLLVFSFNSLQSQTKISADALQKDYQIVEKAFKTLHPGLYRYEDKATVEIYFTDLQKALQSDKTLAETYLTFSQFVAKIKCGHTYCNYLNQGDVLQEKLFDKADKIPFIFRLIDQRMIVTKDASNAQLQQGTEILQINGIEVATIIDSLLTVIPTDGANVGSQLENMQLTGIGRYEAFDVYFPLFFAPIEGKFDLKGVDLNTNEAVNVSVKAMNRTQRFEAMEARYGKQASSYDDMWQFEVLDSQTAYLQLGTFVTWKMELNWKKFLKEAFSTLKAKNIPNLIIDIRGNGGGMDEVSQFIAKQLLTRDITLSGSRSLLTYEKVPADLNPHLTTWSNSFRDRTGKLKSVGDGFYTFKNGDARGQSYKANPNAYRGKTYLIVNPANSSATFLMAKYFKENGLATLVGQETGGNRKGTSGGNLFFLQLPNSKIEIDLPLIGGYPLTEQPNEGIQPDVFVKPSVEDVVKGIDTELEAIKTLIFKGQENNEQRSNTKTNETKPSTAKTSAPKSNVRLQKYQLKVLEGKWTGKLTYLNYGDDKTLVDIPCTFEGIRKGYKIKTKVVYEELNKKGKPMTAKSTFAVKKDGKVLQLNGQWNVTQVKETHGDLLIVGERSGKDNNRNANFRLTVRVKDGQTASWTKEVRYEGTEEFFMRNVFSFTKER